MAENENSPQFDEHEYHLINVRIGICARSFAKYELLSLAKYRKPMYKFWHNGPPPPTAQQTEEAQIMVLSLIKSISVTVKELGKLYHEEWKATNMNPSVGFMIDINTRLIEEVVKKVDNLRGSQLYQRIDHKTNEECNKMVEDTNWLLRIIDNFCETHKEELAAFQEERRKEIERIERERMMEMERRERERRVQRSIDWNNRIEERRRYYGL